MRARRQAEEKDALDREQKEKEAQAREQAEEREARAREQAEEREVQARKRAEELVAQQQGEREVQRQQEEMEAQQQAELEECARKQAEHEAKVHNTEQSRTDVLTRRLVQVHEIQQKQARKRALRDQEARQQEARQQRAEHLDEEASVAPAEIRRCRVPWSISVCVVEHFCVRGGADVLAACVVRLSFSCCSLAGATGPLYLPMTSLWTSSTQTLYSSTLYSQSCSRLTVLHLLHQLQTRWMKMSSQVFACVSHCHWVAPLLPV